MATLAAIPLALRHPDDASTGWLTRVEEAGLNAAQPPEQLLYDGWLLRFSAGKARRARSIQALAAGFMPLDEKIAACSRRYRDLGLPLLFRMTPFSQPQTLDLDLAQRGFDVVDPTYVMALKTAAAVNAKRPAPSLDLTAVDADTFAAVVGALRGSPHQQIAAHRRRLAASPLTASSRRFAVLERGTDPRTDAAAAPLAAGQIVVEDEIAGLYDIIVAGHARGRGLGRALTAALMDAARDQGATTLYLQVDGENAPARHIYRELGFSDRYVYWYRQAPGT